MIKYGVEKDVIFEYCIKKIRMRTMTTDEAIKKCKKHGLKITKDDLIGYL